MRNRFKLYIFTAFILSLFSGCEVDDICTSEVKTPRLVIHFYDSENSSISKKVDTLSVWAINKEKLYDKQSLDSINLPLNPQSSTLSYILKNGSICDTLKIEYTPHEKFISRSCGYIFNFTINDNTNTTEYWINDFEITTAELIEYEQTNIKIYH